MRFTATPTLSFYSAAMGCGKHNTRTLDMLSLYESLCGDAKDVANELFETTPEYLRLTLMSNK
jgi:hypothetical protein